MKLEGLIPPRRGDNPVEENAPPPPPDSWTWDHVNVDASGETIRATIAPPFDRGCLNCYRRHDGHKGYVAVFDNTVRECPDCRVIRRRCLYVNRSRLPSKFHGRRYDWNLIEVDGQRNPSADLFAWAKSAAVALRDGDASNVPSVALLGGTGRGKSHAAFVLAQRVIDLGVQVRWCNWSAVLGSVMDKEKSESQAFGEIYGAGFIVVDDIGVKSYNAWARDITCSFLERLPSDVVAVFTSNGTPDDGPAGLDSMIGARAASRLFGVCGRGSTVFCMGNDDYRKG